MVGRSRSRSPRDRDTLSREPESRKRSRSRSRERHDRHRHRDKSRSRSRSRDGRKEKKRKRDKSAERKERKAEKRRQQEEEDARRVAELSVYSATDNPFHDSNLGQQFKWHKKAEKEKKMGVSPLEAQRRDAIRRQEAKEELERLNKKRADREVEQALREEEEARMARLMESARMDDFAAGEDDFRLKQERRRAGIRLKEKRAKAIDFLALNLKYASPIPEDAKPRVEDDDGLILEAGLEIDLDEPYVIFESLSLAQTEELHDDIEKYLALEQSEVNIDFWTNMMVVCKDRLETLRMKEERGNAAVADANSVVENDVAALLSGKSHEQLSQLQRQIQAKLASGEPIDTDYWEGLLKSLIVWKAKAKLKALHEVVVRNRLEQLRKRQRDEALQAQKELLDGVTSNVAQAAGGWGGDMRAEPSALSKEDLEENLGPEQELEPYERGMSPPLLDISKLPYEERQLEIVDPVEARKTLLELRRAVAASRFVPKVVKTTVTAEEPAPEVLNTVSADMVSEAMYRMDAERDDEIDDELFNTEENITNPTTYTWEDKYRPRKPRYFNRVHTGYEWNKYNQTHYDTDNPPPKVVQGYKFNIFYPDLIDKSKTPSYKIMKEPGNEDTILLHFTAGPPYEDIAFRIVNREWEYSHKRGFRCSFDRGCLSLWFNFRRNFYRK